MFQHCSLFILKTLPKGLSEDCLGGKDISEYRSRRCLTSPDSESNICKSLPCKTYVVFDKEATGWSRSSDITQLSAYDGKGSFNYNIDLCQPKKTESK